MLRIAVRVLSAVLASLASASLALASAPDARPIALHRLPLNGALTQNSVTDMLQDRSGLMWFSTLGGVNVYDGYEFHSISTDPRDPNALSGVLVSRLLEDRDGQIWIAGFYGWLDRFDPRTGRVRHFPRELYGPVDRPTSFAATGLYQDPAGIVWLGTNLGLHRYDPATDKLQTQADAVDGRAPLLNLRELAPASDGRIWVGSVAGLFRFDPKSRDIETFRNNPDDPRSLPGNAINKLHLDPDGTLWVGTNAGLARWDGEGRGFTRFVHRASDPHSLGGNAVADILRDRAGRLWVGCQTGGGLSLLRDDASFEVLLNDVDDPNSLSVNDVWSLFEDRSGLIWIGTAGVGLNQVNPTTHRFNSIRATPFKENSLRSSFVWDIQQDADKRIWMTTLAGLESFDPASGRFATFGPAPEGGAANQMQAILIDRANRFWVGSVDGHLYRFDPADGRFTAIRHPDRPDGRFSGDRVWYLGQGGDGRIWLSTINELVALDPDSGTLVERIPANDRMPLALAPIRTSLVDSDGVMWFGGVAEGLIRYEKGKGLTAYLSHDPSNPGSLSDNGVRSLHESADGTLWVGTHNGLNRMTAADRRAGRNRFKLYTEAEGLANNTIYGILPDLAGRLWLGTNRGLSRLDPNNGEVRNFDSRDGLAGDELNGGAELIATDGTLYFGGVNGLSWFRPEDIPRNTYVPQVRITGVEVAGKPLAGGSIPQRERVEVDYSENDISLAFAVMDFHQPGKNRFRYRLAGLSQEWVETDRHSVNLAKLADGGYRFEVLGSNHDGVWSARPAQLELVVRPPIWRSPVAYGFYALAIASLLLLYHRGQLAKLAREREFSESLASAHSLAEANHQMALRYAQYDHLTQLPNRASLMDALDRYMRFARSQQRKLALFLINLDRFQRINDTLGHKTGDAVLRATAERLQQATADNAFLARVGNDEFALVAICPPGVEEGAWLAATTGRLVQAVAQPDVQSDPPLRMTASIGAAFDSGNLESASDVLGYANIALHAAKRAGGAQVQRYVPGMIESAREKLSMEGRMRRALENGEFVLHYQPQVSAVNGRLLGFEALVRWQTPDQGLLPPARFIGIAEELGLIVDLGRWVLEEACRQAHAWRLLGHDEFLVSVNVSALQLLDPQFVEQVRHAIESAQLPAQSIEIELTESALLENVDAVSATMRALKTLGVALALDDFGVGYSSLSYLKRLPIDKLKIDQTFVREITEKVDDAAIVRAIIAMGHQLQMKVLAEGVETQAQLGYLRRNHCDECQGYFFGMALPAAEAEAILRQRYLTIDAFVATRPVQTLLLLDDEENIRNSLVRLLRRDGLRIFTAGNATEAFAILGRELVQVVVADQRMPDISGTEFLNRVKDMYPDTVRMILSGYTDLNTVTDAINRGAIYKFLTKPWDDADLRAQIADAFRAQVERRRDNAA